MEKPQTNLDHDIVQEHYEGPGRAVTSAGYMAISHMGTMIVSGIVMGTIGFLAHAKVAAVQNTFVRIGEEYGASASTLKNIIGKFVGGIPKAFEWCVDHVPFSEKITGNARFEAKSPSIIFMGGLGVAGGWIGSTIWGIIKGTHHGNKGKHQFERAKEEIKNLREDNDDLNKINDELHAKYVKVATRLDTIQTSQDNAAQAELRLAKELPATQALNAAQTIAPTEVQLSENQHEGKLAKQELAVA